MNATVNTTSITIPGEPELTIATAKRSAMGEKEARTLTTFIQRTTVRLWVLVTEAHDRKAYAALGYPTWDAYVRTELKMSPSRSYQLLDTGHVMKALAKAGADLEAVNPPPARIVARVKNDLPAVQRVARSAIKDGKEPVRALRDLAKGVKPKAKAIPASAVTEPIVRRSGRPTTELVVCPVCVGEGKVSRTLGRRAQAWLKKK